MLHKDIDLQIFQYANYLQKKNLSQSCTLFYTFQQQELQAIITIQDFYRKYRIANTYLQDANLPKYRKFCVASQFDYNDWNVHSLYRYYIAKYPKKYLLMYPEKICKMIINPIRKLQLQHALLQLPEIANRNRKHIYNYFIENKITVIEIFNAGY